MRFDEVANVDPLLCARLIEKPILRSTKEYVPFPRLPTPRRHDFPKKLMLCGHTFRPYTFLKRTPDIPKVTYYDADGKPYIDPAGIPLHIDPGITRDIDVFGEDHNAYQRFYSLAEQASTCLEGAPREQLNVIIASEILRVKEQFTRWMYIIFELALHGRPGANIRTEWKTIFDLPGIPEVETAVSEIAKLKRTRMPPGWMQAAGNLQENPCFRFATLDNLGASSAGAIDILLSQATSESTPIQPPTANNKPPNALSNGEAAVLYAELSGTSPNRPWIGRKAKALGLEYWTEGAVLHLYLSIHKAKKSTPTFGRGRYKCRACKKKCSRLLGPLKECRSCFQRRVLPESDSLDATPL